MPRRSAAPRVLAYHALACALLAGCATRGDAAIEAAASGQLAAARQAYDAIGEHDAPTLRAIARIIVELHAQGRDDARSRAAFAQLRSAGTRAGSTLEWLVFEGRTGRVKARALSLLAALGDEAAAGTLRVLARKDDVAMLRLALPYYDVEEQAERLRSLSAHSRAEVRAGAVARLGSASPDADLTLLLRQLARRDPAPSVRAAALSALARQAPTGGPGVLDAFEAALGDGEQSVRMAAARGLHAFDSERAGALLSSLIGGDVSHHAIEAARTVMTAPRVDEPQLSAARGHLHRALLDDDPKLRSQAAVAFSSLPASLRPVARLVEALSAEKVASVRLQLALSIGGAQAPAAEALRKLMAKDGIDAVTAAAALADLGEADARTRLQALGESTSASVRAAAARALIGQLGLAHTSRALLFDRYAKVQLAAAGALLAL